MASEPPFYKQGVENDAESQETAHASAPESQSRSHARRSGVWGTITRIVRGTARWRWSRPRGWRVWFLTLAAVVWSLTVVHTLRAPSYPSVAERPSGLSRLWYPIEVNASHRLPLFTGRLLSADFVDGATGWAVGEAGTVLRTSEGGRTWSPQDSGTAQSLFGVDFVNANSGWAVGEGGTIIATSDGGSTWEAQNSGTQASLRAVHFTGPQSGCAVGENGAILTTTDGGSSWQPRGTRANQDLLAVHFADARNGWAVGESGMVMATANGGEDWSRQTGVSGETLTGLHFVSPDVGWAVGRGGTVLYTEDGGERWERRGPARGDEASGEVQQEGPAQAAPSESQPGAGKRPPDTREPRRQDQQQQYRQEPEEQSPRQMSPQGGARRGGNPVRSGPLADGARRMARRNRVPATASVLSGFLAAVPPPEQSTSESTQPTTGNGAKKQTTGTPQPARPLRSVWFVTPERGWAVGDGGAILATTDGGETWTPQRSTSEQTLTAVRFVNATNGWAVGEGGMILATTDGGETWVRQSRSPAENLTAVDFIDTRTGWAAGEAGTALATTDGGETWERQSPPTAERLNALSFVDGRMGWAVGANGLILATRNGGASWKEQRSADDDTRALYDVDFVSPTTGWAVGEGGTILSTTNGGERWAPQESETTKSLRAVHFVSESLGWAVGEGGTILSTTNGGAAWEAAEIKSATDLTSVHFVNATTGWAVGEGGTILFTADGGSRWEREPIDTTTRLTGVHAVDESTAWATGEDGTVLHRTAGEEGWTRQGTGAAEPLTSVDFVDAMTGWAVGQGDTILHTRDGGETWRHQRAYRKYPPPLFWIGLLAGAGCLAPVVLFRPPAAPAAEPEGTDGSADRDPQPRSAEISRRFVTDKPIERPEQDVLGFWTLTRGLSEYLRNENTAVPLTIAVEGPWGSGKSSFMHLLQRDLRSWQWQTVAFNVWHHREEKSLLASLLQAVRSQAVPGVLSWQGMFFRARLAAIRMRERLTFTFTVFLVALLAGLYGFANSDELLWLVTAPLGENWTGRLMAGGGVTAALVGGYRLVKAIGADPARLLASLAGRGSTSDLRHHTGFRARFAREFGEVTRALAPAKLLIAIDDLDRCDPEDVMTVLQVLNFLVSAGDCVVVLGMDEQRVEDAVAMYRRGQLLRAAGEEAEAAGTESSTEFARNYLQKLVQIRVRVPRADDGQARTLLVGGAEATSSTAQEELRRLRWRRWKRRGVQAATAAGLVGLVASAALTLPAPSLSEGRHDPPGTVAQAPEAGVQERDGSAAGAAGPSSDTDGEPGDGPPKSEPRSPETVRLVPGQMHEPAWAWTWAPALGLLVFGATLAYVSQERLAGVRQDSDRFREALTRWGPLVVGGERRPRHLKRFVNRMRLNTMLAQEVAGPNTDLAYTVIGLEGIRRAAELDPGIAGELHGAGAINEPEALAERIVKTLTGQDPRNASERASGDTAWVSTKEDVAEFVTVVRNVLEQYHRRDAAFHLLRQLVTVEA